MTQLTIKEIDTLQSKLLFSGNKADPAEKAAYLSADDSLIRLHVHSLTYDQVKEIYEMAKDLDWSGDRPTPKFKVTRNVKDYGRRWKGISDNSKIELVYDRVFSLIDNANAFTASLTTRDKSLAMLFKLTFAD